MNDNRRKLVLLQLAYSGELAAAYAYDCLLEMAEVEWEHELYFRSRVREHFLGRRLPLWPQPPPKETIRISLAREPVAHS